MSGEDIDRRRALAMGAAVAAAGLLPGPALAQGRSKPGRTPAAATPASGAPAGSAVAGKGFLTPHELATLDELAEAIIPADAQSGGARAVGAADAINKWLAHTVDPAIRQSWRDDLAEIDRLSASMFGRPFVRATAEQRDRLLQRISRNEGRAKEAGEHAFATIKWEVSWHYYKSRIGIHDDLQYKGNTLLDEFEGTDVGKR